MPLIYLPCKESIEELLFKGKKRLNMKENIICTLALVFISYLFGIFVPSIGDAMALAGCTTNPMVRKINIKNLLDWFSHSCNDVLEDT